MPGRSRSRRSNQSPPLVSAKREFFKCKPEIFLKNCEPRLDGGRIGDRRKQKTPLMAAFSAAAWVKLERPDLLAGAPGFEPGNGGIKIRCLTTWLRPNRYRRAASKRFRVRRRDHSGAGAPDQRPPATLYK